MSQYKSIYKFDLDDCLDNLAADDLRQMVRWLNIPKPQPTRKADMAKVVKSQLTEQYLRELWQSLDEIDKLAISETLHGTSRVYRANRFIAKYGLMPTISGSSGYRYSLSFPLRFFLYIPDRYHASTLIVPLGLSEILLKFVPAPPEAKLNSMNEIPETVERPVSRYNYGDEKRATKQVKLNLREMEHAACQDVYSVLRLINLGRISVSAKTRKATAASVKRISEELFGGDYFEPEVKKNSWDQVVGPIKAFAWPLLIQAGKFAQLRGSKLELTRAGKSALDASAANTLRHLWGKWLDSKFLDEFSRIDTIKGQTRGKGKRAMSAADERRETIADALCECPVGEWVRFADFSRFMRAEGLEFEITRDEWTLYIADPHYGSLGYQGYHGWPLLQGRYLLCFLFEYASTLGMIDIAFTHPKDAVFDIKDQWGTDELSWVSQYDGLEYFRLTPLGAYCLGMTEDYSRPAALDRTPLTVLPNLRIQAESPLSTAERLTLETFATDESKGVWQLAREKILVALESGHSIDSLRSFLAERDDQPLPETVEGMLRKMEQNAQALKVLGGAVLIECASEQIAAELAAHKHTLKLCQLAGKKHLVVRNQKDKAFRKAVRELGYGLKLP